MPEVGEQISDEEREALSQKYRAEIRGLAEERAVNPVTIGDFMDIVDKNVLEIDKIKKNADLEFNKKAQRTGAFGSGESLGEAAAQSATISDILDREDKERQHDMSFQLRQLFIRATEDLPDADRLRVRAGSAQLFPIEQKTDEPQK